MGLGVAKEFGSNFFGMGPTAAAGSWARLTLGSGVGAAVDDLVFGVVVGVGAVVALLAVLNGKGKGCAIASMTLGKTGCGSVCLTGASGG